MIMEIKPLVKEDYIVLDESTTFSKMIGKLKAFEKRTGLVFRKDKYLGLIQKKKLLKARIDVSKTKIRSYVQKTPIVNENADIIETAYLMFQSNLDYIPVEKDKQIIGVLNALDLVKLAITLPETKGIKVKDIKLLKPSKINKTDPVATAMRVMYKDRVDQVPLYDKGKIYGVISFRDVLRKYLNWSPKRDISAKFNAMASTRIAEAEMPQLAKLPAGSFSTNDNLLTINLDEGLKKAITIMSNNNVYDLLVMDAGEFVGMLTVKNILRRIGSLKIPQNYNIKFVGLGKTKLKPYQKYNIKKIASNETFKLQRQIKNELDLTLHVKCHEKDGDRQKYSVHLRIEFPGQMISSSQEDWDIETALRKTFNNAKNSVKKKFRGDSSWGKYYG